MKISATRELHTPFFRERRRVGRPPVAPIGEDITDTLPRCPSCGLIIFTAPWQAALSAVPYFATINQAVNGRCYGCAVGDNLLRGGHRLTLLESKAEEPLTVFTKLEVAVAPPPAPMRNKR